MAFEVQDRGRVGQSTYWMYFGGNMVLGMFLLIGAISAFMNGSFATGIICFLLLGPMGIYFRIIMMRRCRDIGWPAFLPWLVFGCAIVFGMMNGFRAAANPGTVGSAAAFTPLMLVYLADFILMIVIGCIGSKAPLDYAEIFGDHITREDYISGSTPVGYGVGDQPHSFAPDRGDRGEPNHDRWDAAIARKLAKGTDQPTTEASLAPRAAPMPAMQRRPTGFGRKLA
jgi:uncharacterized membrane protein YhaH (DUF805 family)